MDAKRRWIPTIVLLAATGCGTLRPAGAPPLRLAWTLGAWTVAAGRDHPLVGMIYDVGAQRPATPGDVVDAAASADFTLLGEQHDNPDHHRLQAALLADLVGRGRRPAVAFEQVDLEKQAALDAAAADTAGAPAERATRIAAALAWDRSGWPPFVQYRPVFEVALSAGLSLKAANLSRARMHELFVSAGQPAAPQPGLPVFPEAPMSAMRADIVESHCGHAPEAMVTAMVEGQKRRDATMARVLLDAGDAAVLVCGFAHARRDYGVPAHLAVAAPGRRSLSLAFVEVLPGLDEPAAYAAALHAQGLPFDFVVFTPRVDDEDPCAKFRASLERLRAGPHPPDGAAPPGR